MKINSNKFLKQLPFILIIITIFFHNEILCTKNLKSSNANKLNSTLKANQSDPNATPPNPSSNTATGASTAVPVKVADDYNFKTAMYVVGEVLKKVKTPLKNKDIYEKCIEDSLNVNADSAMKKVWEYFSKVDYKNQEKIKKDPINLFMDEAMNTVDQIIIAPETGVKTKVNCASVCKESSVGEINDILQSELRDLLKIYFIVEEPSIKTKNIITAFIGTYRNTDTARKLIPRLNLYK